MSGLLLLGVIGIWAAIVNFAVKSLARRFQPGAVRKIVVALATVVMFALPVADELISAPLFYKLCEEGTKLKFDPEKIRGRTIFFAKNLQPDISIGLLHGYYIPWRLLDTITKEELISYNSYYVKGGILIRTLGISATNAPLTMRSYCSAPEHPEQQSFLKRYDLKYIDRKEIK